MSEEDKVLREYLVALTNMVESNALDSETKKHLARELASICDDVRDILDRASGNPPEEE